MDFTILPYGISVHAFVAQEYLGSTTVYPCVKNRIYLTTEPTCGKYYYNDGTLHGVLVPSVGEIVLCVEKRVYDDVSIDDMVAIFDKSVNYGVFKVLDKVEPNPYLNCYNLILEDPDANIEDYIYCVSYVRLNVSKVTGDTPQNYVFCQSTVLDDIISGGEIAKPLRVAITSGGFFDSGLDRTLIYIVAEAIISGKSQLFLFGTYATKWISSGSLPDCSFPGSSWVQLTSVGENKNPKIALDSGGSLNVFWEGTRKNQTQIYYTSIGPACLTAPHAALASLLDKQAELLHREEGDRPDICISDKLAIPDDAIDIDIVKGCDPLAENTMWMAATSGDGSVDITDNREIRLSGTPSSGQSMAWTIIDKDESGNAFGNTFVQRQYEVSFNLYSKQPSLTDDEIEDLYVGWRSQFTQKPNEQFSNAPIYFYGSNKLLLGKVDRFFDRFVPILGSYKNPDLIDQFASCDMTTNKEFEAIITGTDSNISHYMIGLMPEKIRFVATNTQTFIDYCDSTGDPISTCQDTYLPSVDQVIYTGRYKLIVIMSPDNFFYGSEDFPDYALIRQVSQPFSVDENGRKFRVYVHYGKLSLEESAICLAHNTPLDVANADIHKYLCTLFVAIDDTVEFAESFFVDFCPNGILDTMDFRIGLGWPSKGQFKSNVFLPYETSIFDYQTVDFKLTDIIVGAPNITFNSDYLVVPTQVRDLTHMNITTFHPAGFGTPCAANTFWTGDAPSISWNTLGSDYYTTAEIPITIEGTNISPSLFLGTFCRDLHLAWQSNRNRYWDIYYSNSTNPILTLPFRFETQITNTESNSLSPSIVVSKEGDRIVVWHDNRNKDFYQIYGAKATPDTTSCDLSNCSYSWRQQLEPETTIENPVPIEIDGTSLPLGCVHYRITFYADAEMNSIIHSAFSLEDQRRWFVYDNPPTMLTPSGITVGDATSKTVLYVPEIQPSEWLENQHLYEISNLAKDKPLLCGVKYYVRIDAYYASSSVFVEHSTLEYRIPCSTVESNIWRINSDLDKWNCSGQGKQDRRISTTNNQCTFPSVSCDFDRRFVIGWTDFRNNDTSVKILDYYPEIYYGYWDLSTDIVWSSGSGKSDARMFPKGYRVIVQTDPAGLFYFATYYDNKIPVYGGPVTNTSPTTTYTCLLTDDIFYNLDEASTNPDQYLKLRVYEEDAKGSFVLNANNVVSVVQDCLVRLDIVGLPGAYAVRLKNENDSDWSDWIKIDNRRVDQILGYDATSGKTENEYMSAYSINEDRFIVPWLLSSGSGMKRACVQLLTYFGISRIFCLDMLLNIEELEYEVKIYNEPSLTTEVSTYNGYPVVSVPVGGKVYFTVRFLDKYKLKFYLDKIYLLNIKYSDLISLTYNVIQQGVNDLLDQPLTNLSEGLYKGDFVVNVSDGVYNKDGLAAIIVNIPNPCTRIQKILPGAGTNDFYNLMNLNLLRDFYVKYDKIFADITPEALLDEYKSSGMSRVTGIVSLYDYYKADDPRFMFGNPKFFMRKVTD